MTPAQAWTILGLNPTNDKRAINRAYAQCLRRTRPEDDLQAFSALVEARRMALDLANLIAPEDEATQPPPDRPASSLPEKHDADSGPATGLDPADVPPRDETQPDASAGSTDARPIDNLFPPPFRGQHPYSENDDAEPPPSGADDQDEEAEERSDGAQDEIDRANASLPDERPEPSRPPPARLPPRYSGTIAKAGSHVATLEVTLDYFLGVTLNRKPTRWNRSEWEPVLARLAESGIDDQRESSMRLLKGLLSILPPPAEMSPGSKSFEAILWIVGVLAGYCGHDTQSLAARISVKQSLIWSDWLSIAGKRSELSSRDATISRSDWHAVLPLSYHLMALFPLRNPAGSDTSDSLRFFARFWSRAKFALTTLLFPSYTAFEAGIGFWGYLCASVLALVFVWAFLFTLGSAALGSADLFVMAAHQSLKAVLDMAGMSQALVRQYLIATSLCVRVLPLLLIPFLIGRYARARLRRADTRCLVSPSQRAPVLDPCLNRSWAQAGQLLDVLSLIFIALLFLVSPGGALSDTAWQFLGEAEPRSLADRGSAQFLQIGTHDRRIYIGYRLASSTEGEAEVGLSSCRPERVGVYRCRADLRLPGKSMSSLDNPDGLPAFRVNTPPDGGAVLDFSPIIYRGGRDGGWIHPPLISICARGDVACQFFLGRGASAITAVTRKTESGARQAVALLKPANPGDPTVSVHLQPTPTPGGLVIWLDGVTRNDEALFMVANGTAMPLLYAQGMNQPPRLLGQFPSRPVDQLDVKILGDKLFLRGWFAAPDGSAFRGYIAESGRIREVLPEDQVMLLRKGGEQADKVFTEADRLDYSVDGGKTWRRLVLPRTLRDAMFVADRTRLYAYGRAGIYVRPLASLAEQ